MANHDEDDDDDIAQVHDLNEARDPKNGERWDAAQEGAELLSEGDNAGAVAELERVIRDDADNEYALFFLGNAHFEGARFDKAMKAYLEAARVKPGYLGALAGVGHSLRMLGKHHEALRVAKQILLKSKDDPDGLHIAGLAHFATRARAMQPPRIWSASLQRSPRSKLPKRRVACSMWCAVSSNKTPT